MAKDSYEKLYEQMKNEANVRKESQTIEKSEIPPVSFSVQKKLREIKFNSESFPVTYAVSVVAACIAELVTYPLDLTKTRLQIQGETASEALSKTKAKYRGMMATGLGIIREEGFLKLWQGITPAIYRHAVYSGIRICSFDWLRHQLAEPHPDGVTKDLYLPMWKSAIAGVTAGAFAQYLASPADLVKVQVQMDGRRRLMGEAPRIQSINGAFVDIYRIGGIRGLWKGSIPNVQRAALVNLGDLTTYDVIKRNIIYTFNMKDNYIVHLLASFAAGFVAAIMGTPADVIKTRVMNQPVDDQGRGLLYKGSVDCFMQTITKEGVFALYKGFLPCWIRLAPWALVFWMSFEQIRVFIGASGY